jgi:hypothetical protein
MGRISMPQGKGSQMHNRRDYEKIGRDIPDNIDQTKTKDNVVLVDMDIKEAYKDIFGEAVERYNDKQKRADRKIADYYDKIEHSKNGEKLFYEDVLQWGKKEDFEADPQLREKAKDALKEYAENFQERNPNLRVIGAYIHMDEASPHLHLDYVPVAHGYKTGMDTRNSLDKALGEQGIEVNDRKRTVKDKETGTEQEVTLKEGRYNNRTMAWKDREREYFESICRERGLEVEEKQQARGSLSVEEYKEAKERMIKPLQEQAHALKEGGAYTNEQGEREYIGYSDSIKHMEDTKERLKDNVKAYEKGGFFYDWEKQEGHSIPDGGIEQTIKDAEAKAEQITKGAETEAERITGEATDKAEDILKNANDQADKLLDRLEGYETAQKAQIDEKVKIYEQDQKEGIQDELEGLRGQLDHTRDAIQKNNGIIQKQVDQYAENQGHLKEQDKQISEKSDKVQELDGQISVKEKQIKALDKVGSKIRSQELDIHSEQVGGVFNKHEATVIEGYSPKELERVFQRANIGSNIKKTVEKANTDAQGIIKQAQEQAREQLAQAQRTIDQANEVLRSEAERKRKLEEYEKTVKEENAKLTADNQKLRNEYRAYTQGWDDRDGNRHGSIDELRQEVGQVRAELSGLRDQESEVMERLHDLSQEADRKLAFVDAQLNPKQLQRMLDDSTVSNLVQDTMFETCKQLHKQGLLQEEPAFAFMKLDKKPILEQFKDRAGDFIDKVKDHIQEIAERVVTHHRSR